MPIAVIGTVLLGMASPLAGTAAAVASAWLLLTGRPIARVAVLCIGLAFAVHWFRLTDPLGWDQEVRPTRRDAPAESMAGVIG